MILLLNYLSRLPVRARSLVKFISFIENEQAKKFQGVRNFKVGEEFRKYYCTKVLRMI